MPRLVSGGAVGADECFEQCAAQKGHHISVISFSEHAVTADPANVVQMPHHYLEKYASRLESVAECINRRVPGDGYVRWLLLRNIVVTTKVDEMYAVISETVKAPVDMFIGVPGGTGWTTQCFAMEYLFRHQNVIKSKENVFKIPLWVFDHSRRWHQLICQLDRSNSIFYWQVLSKDENPTITLNNGVYAGVGSREFTTPQRQAIHSLFELSA